MNHSTVRQQKWIGITGGIASGKSMVSRFIIEAGYEVIDADRIVHSGYLSSSKIYHKILAIAGTDCLVDGQICRDKVSKKIRDNIISLQDLESIIHPYVRSEVNLLRSNYFEAGERMVFYDVPLLFEKNMQNDFFKTVLVYCHPEQQVQRLMKRDHCSEKTAHYKISLQMSLDEKKQYADCILENTKDIAFLNNQINELLQSL